MCLDPSIESQGGTGKRVKNSGKRNSSKASKEIRNDSPRRKLKREGRARTCALAKKNTVEKGYYLEFARAVRGFGGEWRRWYKVGGGFSREWAGR